MADNVGYTPGAGATVAADDIGGVLFQRVKLTIGADGANNGDVSGSNPVPVKAIGGANPVVDYQTSAALAAGATVSLTSAEAAGKKLAGVDVWSSVPFKVTLHTVDNSVESAVKGIGGADALCAWQLRLPVGYVALGTTAGTDAFRVKVTNLDQDRTADVYAVFMHED